LVELLLEEISRDDMKEITSTLKGSELLGGLKQAIDVESIAVRRMWELLQDFSFEELVCDL
jgi:hypothetical protein